MKTDSFKLKCQACQREKDVFGLIRQRESKRVGRYVNLAICVDCLEKVHECSICSKEFKIDYLHNNTYPHCSEECYEVDMGINETR